MLSRPIYSIYITRNIILAQIYFWEISEWNVNKSGNRLYIHAQNKGGVVAPLVDN